MNLNKLRYLDRKIGVPLCSLFYLFKKMAFWRAPHKFSKENVKKILDVGTWTGEYAIGLAKRSSYSILGLDSSPIMIKRANEKRAKLPKEVRNRINFVLTDYSDLGALNKDKFDAVIFMGNCLAYNLVNLNDLFKNLSSPLFSYPFAECRGINKFNKCLW